MNLEYLHFDYIIVDEISMVCEIFYKFFLMIKQLKPSIKFIIVGDFNQLDVVNDRVENVNYKNSKALHELCNDNRLTLLKCRRSDDIMFNKCKFETINELDINEFKHDIKLKNIAYTHKKRIEINDKLMKEGKLIIEAKNRKNKLKISKGIFELKAIETDPHSQDVILYNDMPLISHVNNKELDIFNNEEFIIKKIDDFFITIQNERGLKKIQTKDFQRLLYPAYCITMHASQGSTFDEEYTIHEWKRLSRKAKYVALTRGRTLENINIIS
jgi:ATP-dependent exoDNAse (exonuclease V) alpha subunit